MSRIRHLFPIAVATAALALPSTASAAPSVTYTGVSSAPTGIAPGPDGNVWFGAGSGVGRIGLDGALAEFAGASGTSTVQGITAGPDAGVWYAQWGANSRGAGVGRVAVSGAATALYRSSMSASSTPTSIVAGPDGRLWFTEQSSGEVAAIVPGTGRVTEYALDSGARPYGIAVGSDGNLWVTGLLGKLWRLTPAGATSFTALGFTPGAITTAADGKLWVADQAGAMVRIDPATGARASFPTPSGVKPMGVGVGPDGAAWFTSGYVSGSTPGVGRVGADGAVSFTATTGVPLVPAAGPDGAVWFTDNALRRVGRLVFQAPALGAVSAAPVGATAASVAVQVKANGPGATAVVQYGPSTAYGSQSAAVAVPATAAAAPVALPLGGLTPGATYHARVVVSNGAGATTGSDVTFTAPAATPVPVVGKSVVVAELAGSVRVKVGGAWVDLAGARQIPVGATFDTTRGTVALTSVKDAKGTLQTGEFRGGQFQVKQSGGSKPVTELVLKGTLSCSARASAAAASRKQKTKRLWGKDDHGSFRTRGRDSVATVRGTEWFTQETCAGTLTRVTAGAVDVRDLRTHKTHRVKAGHRYLARRAAR